MSTPDTTIGTAPAEAVDGFSLRRAFARARPRRPRLGPGAARDRGHLDDLPDRQRPLPQRRQPLQPDAADRRDRDDLDRRRARPAAGRDRPLGRRGQRPRRRRDGGAHRPARLGAAARDRRRARRRGRDRRSSTASSSPSSASRRSWSRSPACSPCRGRCLWVLGDTGSVNLPPTHHHRPDEHLLRPGRRLDPRRSPRSSPTPASLLLARRRREAAGLEVAPIGRRDRCRSALVAAAVIAAVLILNADRGVPLAARDRRRADDRVHVHHRAHPLRAPHLRRRRQRGGGAARRDQRQPDQDQRLHARLDCWPRSAGSSPPRACWRSTSSRAPATCCCSRSPAR